MITLPRLYAILDDRPFPKHDLKTQARELASGGAALLQYRNQSGNSLEMLQQGRKLRQVLGNSVKLIMNDRADLCLAAGYDGVHLGQDDLSPADARKILGERFWIGLSAHNIEQLVAGDDSPTDYIAIGPVFSTSSKANPDPAIGVEGVRRARRFTQKPLVAIGGITRANCHAVMDAGADSVAVISDLLQEPRKSVEEFLRILG